MCHNPSCILVLVLDIIIIVISFTFVIVISFTFVVTVEFVMAVVVVIIVSPRYLFSKCHQKRVRNSSHNVFFDVVTFFSVLRRYLFS